MAEPLVQQDDLEPSVSVISDDLYMADPTPPAPEGAGSPDPGQHGLIRRLAGGTGWLTLAQTLPLVFNLALTPFIIHGLGVDIYGIFLLVAVIQQFIGSVDGGVGPSARRYFGIYAGKMLHGIFEIVMSWSYCSPTRYSKRGKSAAGFGPSQAQTSPPSSRAS